MRIIFSTIILSILFSVGCAHKEMSGDLIQAKAPEKKQEVVNTSDEAYKCVVNKDTRLIQLDKSTKRCEIHYTKFGEKIQVAWAENTPSICTDVFSKIRTNIEAKGFKCQSLNETANQKAVKKEAKRESASIKQ